MDKGRLRFLINKCKEIRYMIVDELGTCGVGHVGGSLSPVEALVTLYYEHMNVDPENPSMNGRDRFVLSKGHAGPSLYAVLADRGFFSKDWLHTLNKPYTRLPSHADMNLTPGVDMTAGSLGQGLSCAVGMAIGSRLCSDGAYVFAMIGDGESQEGQIWEAAMYAGNQNLDNLIVFTDYNKEQIDGLVCEVNGIEPLTDKWKAFGWYVLEADGHDIEAIDNAVICAKKNKGKPSMIILHTVKGKGLSRAEQTPVDNHSMTFTCEQYQAALKELRGECSHE